MFNQNLLASLSLLTTRGRCRLTRPSLAGHSPWRFPKQEPLQNINGHGKEATGVMTTPGSGESDSNGKDSLEHFLHESPPLICNIRHKPERGPAHFFCAPSAPTTVPTTFWASQGQYRRHGFSPLSGRPPGDGNGNPLQSSFLVNPMDRGDWQPTVHGVAKSQTQLSDQTTIRLTKMSTLPCA